MRGQRLVLVAGVLVWGALGQAASAVDIALAKVREIRTPYQMLAPAMAGQYFVYGAGGAIQSMDVQSGERRSRPYDWVVSRIPGGGSWILLNLGVRVGERLTGPVHLYDVASGGVQVLSQDFKGPWVDVYYQGARAFVTQVRTEAEEGPLLEVDLGTGQTIRQVTIPGEDSQLLRRVHSMSPDKRLLLVGRNEANGVRFWVLDIENGVVVGESFGEYMPQEFLSNSVLYTRRGLALAFELYDLRGRLLDTVNLTVGDEVEREFFNLSPELRYLARRKVFRGDEVYYLYDLKPLRDYLQSRNLMFRPVAGAVNASGVRVRENANLSAKTLGELSSGDELEVIDRSGTKARIGTQDAWWYRVRRVSDGLEGWSYGAYIDVELEQPEPTPAATSAGAAR